MSMSRSDLMRWQFELTWSLFEYHLDRLHPDEVLWEPAPLCWTVRRGDSGAWVPDWEESEPDPIPIPTIAWVMWHIDWWWTVTLDHLQGLRPRERTEIVWPGDSDVAVARLRQLRDEWASVIGAMSDTDLDAPAPCPWPDGRNMTVAHTIAWVDVELTKNVAEIGQLRLLRGARA